MPLYRVYVPRVWLRTFFSNYIFYEVNNKLIRGYLLYIPINFPVYAYLRFKLVADLNFLF